MKINLLRHRETLTLYQRENKSHQIVNNVVKMQRVIVYDLIQRDRLYNLSQQLEKHKNGRRDKRSINEIILKYVFLIEPRDARMDRVVCICELTTRYKNGDKDESLPIRSELIITIKIAVTQQSRRP